MVVVPDGGSMVQDGLAACMEELQQRYKEAAELRAANAKLVDRCAAAESRAAAQSRQQEAALRHAQEVIVGHVCGRSGRCAVMSGGCVDAQAIEVKVPLRDCFISRQAAVDHLQHEEDVLWHYKHACVRL